MIATTKPFKTAANEPRWRKTPWRDSAGYWYLFHEGRKQSLTAYDAPLTCTGRKGTKLEREQAREARDRFLALEAERVRVPEPVESVLTVADVLKPYRTKHVPTIKTAKQSEAILKVFCEGREKWYRGCLPFVGLGLLPFADLTSKHLHAWEAAHPNWKAGGRTNAYQTLKAAFEYAMTYEGGELIDRNPIAKVKSEKIKPREDWINSKAEEEALRKHCGKAFRLIYDAMIDLGARPMELGVLTTDHIETLPGGGLVWKLKAHEWKNGHRTNKGRAIYISARWQEYSREKMAEAERVGHPVLLFSTGWGTQWTSTTISRAFRRAKRRAIAKGETINPDLVAYSLRHTAITRLVKEGSTLAETAKMCGTSVLMLQKHYVHLDEEHERFQAIVDRRHSAK